MEEETVRRDTDSLSWRIIESVESAAGIDPLALEPRLCDVVDADALARLVGSDAVEEVQFEYGEHTVVVRGDGTVSVDGSVPIEQKADARPSGSLNETIGEYHPRRQES